MILTGFADEAAFELEGQIRATRELGWSQIEARSVGDRNLNDIAEDEFERVVAALDEAGISINCLGSTIANWGTDLSEPFAETLAQVERAITRMTRARIPMVRIMSYRVCVDGQGRAIDQQETERFRRLNEICRRFSDAGIVTVHENCYTYGGMSKEHCERLLDAVEQLQLVFDSGNPPLTNDFSRPYPYPKQSGWEFYRHVRERIVHVHVKDAFYDAEADREVYTFPGDGAGEVRRILADLCGSGYSGALSIEPHMAVVFHDSSVQSDAEQRFGNYVEYGRRLERLLAEIGYPAE